MARSKYALQVDRQKLAAPQADLFSLPIFEQMARGPLRVVRWRY